MTAPDPQYPSAEPDGQAPRQQDAHEAPQRQVPLDDDAPGGSAAPRDLPGVQRPDTPQARPAAAPPPENAPTERVGEAQLSDMIAGLQGQLAGTGRSGIPQVDAALDRLADLDPDDLAAAPGVLADVLSRLESAMSDDGSSPDSGQR